MTRAWPCTALLAGILLVATPSPRFARAAAQPKHAANDTVFIPPGNEELFAGMLGRNATLPAGCAFVSGQIERAVVRGFYTCSGAEVGVELRHPSAAPPDAARSEKIAIVTTRGAPPSALLAALQARVREREGAFAWPKVERTRSTFEPGCKTLAPLPSTLEPYVPRCYSLPTALLVGVAQIIAMILGLGYGLSRLLRAPRTSNAE